MSIARLHRRSLHGARPRHSFRQSICSLEDKPTLTMLQCFHFTGSRRKGIYIIEATARRWRNLGIALGFSSDRLDIIEISKFKEVEDCCQELLKQWLQGCIVGKPITWQTLILAMEEAGCTVVTQELRKALNWEQDTPKCQSPATKRYGVFWSILFLVLIAFIYCLILMPSVLPDSLVEYQGYLRDYYSDRHYPLHSKQVFSTHRPERPINLAMISKEKTEEDKSSFRVKKLLSNGSVTEIQKWKVSVKMTEIGSQNGGDSAAKFVLIEGGPGMGKSTLCWQLCRLWIEGKLLHAWDLMVIVELRDESTRRASSLYDLFFHPDDETRLAIAQDIKTREGKGLLIILDGYDEMPEEQQGNISVIQGILTNKLLRRATVVVTSRTHAISYLPSQFKQGLDQHIEIAGFNENEIQEYITSAYGHNQGLLQALRSYFTSHPFVLTVMYNPLHCTIVTELYRLYWENDDQKAFAPNTLNELYYALLLNLLRYNLQLPKLKELSDLPEADYDNLMQVAKLAAMGLKEGKYYFDDVQCDTLDLMVPVQKLYDTRARQPTSYTFLHLTLQEYLAVYYWSQLPDQEPEEFLKSELTKCVLFDLFGELRHFPFCLFYAGLANITIGFSAQLASRQNFYLPNMCELLFEAQSTDFYFVKTEIFDSASYQLSDLVAFPVTVITWEYCFIKNSDNVTTWFFKIRDRKHIQAIANGMHSAHGSAEWDETNGPNIRMYLMKDVNEILEVFPRLYPYTKSVTVLVILSGDLNENSIQVLKDIKRYCPRLIAILQNSLRPLLTVQHSPLEQVFLHLILPHDNELLNNLNFYQPAVTELYLYPEGRFDCNECKLIDVCDSLLQVLPKFESVAQLNTITLMTQDVIISYQCVFDIAQSLRKTIIMTTDQPFNASDYETVKTMFFFEGFNHVQAAHLLQLLEKVSTQNRIGEVLLSDCDAAKVLTKEAIKHKPFSKKLVLYINKSCKSAFYDVINFSDRIELKYY